MRLLLKNMGLYEYHIVHLAILSDALKVASSSEKLCSYMLRGLWKSAVNIVFHSEREENISNKELKPIQKEVFQRWQGRKGPGVDCFSSRTSGGRK